MEKRKPHCPLAIVLSMVAEGRVQATQSALAGAAAMGLDYSAMIDLVQALGMHDFYKSMTARNDYRVWQDVYRPMTDYGSIYMKLTVIDDVVIISFKEQ